MAGSPSFLLDSALRALYDGPMNSSPIRWRKRGPRFDEIAVAAGVSVATVDRVLNERGSVSSTARERVVAAARQLGVGRILPELHHKLVRIDLLLLLNETRFSGNSTTHCSSTFRCWIGEWWSSACC